MREKKDSFRDSSFKSKKQIIINKNTPIDHPINQEKIRVFEIQEKSEINYHQAILSGEGT